MEQKGQAGVKNVVLVHGGFVDGSGWQGVHAELRKQGYAVTVVQNPLTSLADDWPGSPEQESHACRQAPEP